MARQIRLYPSIMGTKKLITPPPPKKKKKSHTVFPKKVSFPALRAALRDLRKTHGFPAIGLGSVSTSGFSKRLDQATSCAKPDLHGAHRGSSCSNDLASLALASIDQNPQKNPCEKAILFEGFFLCCFFQISELNLS